MARKPRIEIAGYYHIINKGVIKRTKAMKGSEVALPPNNLK